MQKECSSTSQRNTQPRREPLENQFASKMQSFPNIPSTPGSPLPYPHFAALHLILLPRISFSTEQRLQFALRSVWTSVLIITRWTEHPRSFACSSQAPVTYRYLSAFIFPSPRNGKNAMLPVFSEHAGRIQEFI
jgi:hypothetical protein